jgi:Carboxyltransferase domain, subdomain A and B
VCYLNPCATDKGRAGDCLSLGAERESIDALVGRKLRPELVPKYSARWEVRAIAGPDDYLFTPESVQKFSSADWTLNPKSDRTGHRYVGPQLFFLPARADHLIHDAGADPSNIVIDGARRLARSRCLRVLNRLSWALIHQRSAATGGSAW